MNVDGSSRHDSSASRNYAKGESSSSDDVHTRKSAVVSISASEKTPTRSNITPLKIRQVTTMQELFGLKPSSSEDIRPEPPKLPVADDDESDLSPFPKKRDRNRLYDLGDFPASSSDDGEEPYEYTEDMSASNTKTTKNFQKQRSLSDYFEDNVPSLPDLSNTEKSGEALNMRKFDKSELIYNLGLDSPMTPSGKISTNVVVQEDTNHIQVEKLQGTASKSASMRSEQVKTAAKRILACIVWIIIAILIQLLAGNKWAFPDGKGCLIDDDSSFIPRQNSSMCFLQISLIDVVKPWRILTAFIIAGYVKVAIDRSKEERKLYFSLVSHTRQLLSVIGCLIRNEEEKRKLSRWTMLAFELTVLEIRGNSNSQKGIRFIYGLNLFSGVEWDMMNANARYASVWQWVQQDIVNLGEISNHLSQQLSEACAACSRESLKITNSIGNGIPNAYIRACKILINFHLFFESISIGVYHAVLHSETDGNIWRQPGLYCNILSLLGYSIAVNLLFDIHSDIRNPFGTRPDDINHDFHSSSMRQFVRDSLHMEIPVIDDDATISSLTEVANSAALNAKIARSVERRRKRVSLLGYC